MKLRKLSTDTSQARTLRDGLMTRALHPTRLLAALAATLPFQGRDKKRERSEIRECPAALRQVDRLIAKLFTYSSGFVGSKVFPITEKLLDVAAGGVRPTSFISLVVSVARNTCLATP